MKNSRSGFPPDPSSDPVTKQPETVPELLRKYGTYNIQPTSETDNPYPVIAAGLGRPHEEMKKAVNRVDAEKRAHGSAEELPSEE